MSKLKITKREDATGNEIHVGNYDITIDGKPLEEVFDKVIKIDIELEAGKKPVVYFKTVVDEIEIETNSTLVYDLIKYK